RLGAALDLPVRAVTTWVIDPVLAGYVPVDTTGPEETARAILDQSVAAAFDGEPPVDLQADLVYGPAAPTLVEESRTASMLVVGSRGLGGFGAMLPGPVSQRCVQPSNCPGRVIRPQPRDGPPAPAEAAARPGRQ